MKTSSRKASRSISLENDEVGMVGLREQEELLEDPLDPAELVERDVDLVERPVPVLSQHLEMPARDRRRSTQLVRDVVEELLLLLEQRGALVRLALHLLSASWRRRACQTIARNIADMSGTSKSSPHSCSPLDASLMIRNPVEAATRASTKPVTAGPRSGSRRGASG